MKRLVLLLLTILLLGAFALPTAALPIDDLTTLAGYFPEGSVIYASARTDDDFIATLDGVLTQVGQVIPEVGGTTLTQALDLLASGIKSGATFQDLFRPWLGNTAAIGMFPLTTTDDFNNPIELVVISITDRDAAEAFFQSVTGPREYVQTQGDGFTTYESTRDNTHLVFRDDVILIASNFGIVANGGAVTAPLSGSADFNTALGLLPGSDYNAAVYVDTRAFVSYAADNSVEAFGQPLPATIAGLEPQAFGFTILDGTALTIEGVSATNVDALGVGSVATAPLDLGLLTRIPAGTPLLILGSSFADSYSLILDQIQQLASLQGMESDATDIQTGLWALDFGIRGFTGMDFQSEILPALNGTYALYAGVNPAAEGAQTAFDLITPDLLLDFALTFGVTDAAVAVELRDNLIATLSALPTERQDNINISFEDSNGTPVIVIGVETDSFSGEQVEVLLGVSDEVFSFGTRRYVEAALNPGIGLDQDPQWQAAAQYFVPESYSLLYQSSDNLATLVDIFERTGTSDTRDLSLALGALTGLVSSSSISYGALSEGGIHMRAVLTLNGE